MSKLPFKKKLTDEEEEHEYEEEELEEEELQTSNTEGTHVLDASQLEEAESSSDGEDAEDVDEDEDEEEEDSSELSLKEKIDFHLNKVVSDVKKFIEEKIPKKKNKSLEGDENLDEAVQPSGEGNENSDDVTQANIKAPDKKKKLIHGAIILGLVFFIAEEFLKEEVPQTPVQKVPPSTNVVENNDVAKAPQAEPTLDTPADTSNTDLEQAPKDTSSDFNDGLSSVSDASDSNTSSPSESLNIEEGSPIDSTVSDIDLGDTPSDLTLTDTAPTDPSVSDSAPSDLTLTDTASTDPSVSDSAPSDLTLTDTAPTDPAITDSTPDFGDLSLSEDSAPSLGDSPTGEGSVVDGHSDLSSPIPDGSEEGDLTEKILEDLEKQTSSVVKETPVEYIAPPDYEYPGRGLVYNCKAQHWACVDGPSYKVCEDNSAYLKSQNGKPECHPYNVYETTKGCTAVQNRIVSAGTATDFCK